MNPTFQLVLVPGMGADGRLFEPQREAFPQLQAPAWIPPTKNESLASYAARLAETVSPAPAAPLILGGASFGGMLAYEMARRLKPRAVVLIGSCCERRSLRPSLRWLMPLFSEWTWNAAKMFAGPLMRVAGGTSVSQSKLLATMFREMDSLFMRWSAQAILSWDPAPLEGVPVLHIHGGRDRMIPARRVKADELIPDGGHLINVTHAEQVNAFLRKAMETS
jgi:pimeloyl-ACP methyl ester carboxylesterase